MSLKLINLVSFILLAFAYTCTAIPQYASTIRPPAYPLAVRNPYTNVWLQDNTLPGNWPKFWTGRIKAWTGMVKVDDDKTYVWMGSPNLGPGNENMTILAQQIGNGTVTPTQTHFFIKAGPLDLNVSFFSPVEIHDIPRQSIPLSYLTVSVASNDGASHNVQLYTDISAEWTTSDLGQVVNWTLSTTPSGIQYWTSQQTNQYKFGEVDEFAGWGSALLGGGPDATTKSGSDISVRMQFVSNASLDNTDDTRFRCASCEWPTFGIAYDMGSVSSAAKVNGWVVGHIREENVNWLGAAQKALWLDTWPDVSSLVDFFWFDLETALLTADALDEKILSDAFTAGGQDYADILAYSLRQSYAGNEFSGGGGGNEPIYYQKEISSGAFMQTVDVIYPTVPMFIYTNITYLQLLLDPLFYQMENGIWDKPFAMHDIGARYPNAVGQGYGGDMPVEESANMIMMVADIVFHPETTITNAIAYARQHHPIMSIWAQYLLDNCLYPVDQLTTDDFIGTTELNSGLALKGILGMAAYAKISRYIANLTEAVKYEEAVASYVPIWLAESIHADGTHLKMEYNVSNGYQFKYNALHDHLLELGVVPQEVYDMEAAYYETVLETYGGPFVSTHDYTKSDWEMWTAAAFGDANPTLRTGLVQGLARFLRTTNQRVPFTDWYVTSNANHVGFQARPVAGGHFALLARNVMGAGAKKE